MAEKNTYLFWARVWLIVFIAGLLFSFQMILFVEPEITWISDHFGQSSRFGQALPAVGAWVDVLEESVTETYSKYPAMAYCMDYLALSQLVIALFIAGAVKDPVKNAWVVRAAMIACIVMIPFAFASGYVRQIPFFWVTLDSSFAMLGIIPLLIARRCIRKLRQSQEKS